MKINKTTIIVGGLIVLGVLVLLGIVSFKQSAPGALIGGVATLWAAVKSRIFGRSASEIRAEHAGKREEWAGIQTEYDSAFQTLKSRMDYLDYRSALISKQLDDLSEADKVNLTKLRSLPEKDKLALFRELFPSGSATP